MCEVEIKVDFEEVDVKTNENGNNVCWESPVKVKIPEPEPVKDENVYRLMAEETGGYYAMVTPFGAIITDTDFPDEYYPDEPTPEKLVIPDTLNGIPVVAIEAWALLDCKSKEIVLPDSCLGFISDEWTDDLEQITDYERHIRSCLYISDQESIPPSCEKVVLGKNTKLHSGIFYNCINLKEIVIPNPENITYIDDFAFAGCRSLVADFEFPNLKVIERKAFIGCKNVKITLPDDMTKIAINLFTSFPKENVRYSDKLAERIGKAFLSREINIEEDIMSQTLYLGKVK